MRKMRNYHDYRMEELADLEEAIGYLEVVLEEYQKDGDTFGFLIGLRNVVEAQGGINELIRRTDIDSQDLLKVLSSNDKQDLDTLEVILNDLGALFLFAKLENEPLNWKYTEMLNYLVPMIDHPNPHLNLINASVAVESLNHAVPAVD
jgi:DNA-binding phage protein